MHFNIDFYYILMTGEGIRYVNTNISREVSKNENEKVNRIV